MGDRSRRAAGGPQIGKTQNTLRFAWWGAEESGLVGSTNYVNGLSQAEKDRIALYLNFDMVGSPNYVFMTQDADQSSFTAPVAVPPGSTQIEDLFESFYTLRDEPYDDAAFDGRSDYQAFIVNNIPAGGLFTGAEVEKTAEQQAIWGGTVGVQFDPCYHEVCDTFANNSDHALEVNADSIAFALLTYAYSTESVNGVPGKRVPGNFQMSGSGRLSGHLRPLTADSRPGGGGLCGRPLRLSKPAVPPPEHVRHECRLRVVALYRSLPERLAQPRVGVGRVDGPSRQLRRPVGTGRAGSARACRRRQGLPRFAVIDAPIDSSGMGR